MALPAPHFSGRFSPFAPVRPNVGEVVSVRVPANQNIPGGFSRLEAIGAKAKRLARRQFVLGAIDLAVQNLQAIYPLNNGFSPQGWTEICNIGPYDYVTTPNIGSLCGHAQVHNVAALIPGPYTQGPDAGGNYTHWMGLWRINAVLPGPSYAGVQNQVWQKVTGSPTEPTPTYRTDYGPLAPIEYPMGKTYHFDSPSIRPGAYRLGKITFVSPGGNLDSNGLTNARGEHAQYVYSVTSKGIRVTAGYGGHFLSKNTTGEREGKGGIRALLHAVTNAVGGFEEMVSIIHGSIRKPQVAQDGNTYSAPLPSFKYGKNGFRIQKDIRDKFYDIVENWRYVDMTEFNFGMTDDQLEDVQIGAQQEFIKKGLGNRGGTVALGAGSAF